MTLGRLESYIAVYDSLLSSTIPHDSLAPGYLCTSNFLSDFNLTVFNNITASNQCNDTRTSSTVKLKTVKTFEVHEYPDTSESWRIVVECRSEYAITEKGNMSSWGS